MRSYHKIVQDGIVSFGESHKGNEVLSVNKRKFYVNHPTNRKIKPIEYQPDGFPDNSVL